MTTLEVTYGSNGWHPHLHMLVFTGQAAFDEGKPDDATGDLHSATITALASKWVTCLAKVGLCDRPSLAECSPRAWG